MSRTFERVKKARPWQNPPKTIDLTVRIFCCMFPLLPEKTMKTLYRWLLILLFATTQIPMLPLCALVIAQIDKGHRICLSEEDGVVTMVLRHDQVQTRHLNVLDALICIEANKGDTQDHVMNFVHSKLSLEPSRSTSDQDEIAASEAWIEGDEMISLLGDQPPVAEEIPVARIRGDHTRIPIGLRQTVILV